MKNTSFNPHTQDLLIICFTSIVKYIGSGGETNHVQQKILRKCVFRRALNTSLYREQKWTYTLLTFALIIQVHRAKGSIERHENFHNREKSEERIARNEEDTYVTKRWEKLRFFKVETSSKIKLIPRFQD